MEPLAERGGRVERGETGAGTPRDIWDRMARLDRHCHIVVESLYEPGASGRGENRWCVTIARRDHSEKTTIQCRGATVVDALARAVEEAEGRAWDVM